MLRLPLFRMSAGFNTLREFVASRPTLRHEALRVLLELTTHEGTFYTSPFSELELTFYVPRKDHARGSDQHDQALGTRCPTDGQSHTRVCVKAT